MQDKEVKNSTIHISSRSHLNLTFNLYQCGVNELVPEGALNLRASDTFTLLYINSGEGLLESNGLAFKISAEQGIFTFPDLEYALTNVGHENMEITWLTFTGYRVENYLNRANIFRVKPIFRDEHSYIRDKINGIYVASQHVPNRYCRMASAVYDIFSRLLDTNPTRNADAQTASADFYSVKAVDYIERNYAKNISVDDIATALGISRKHLYSIFTEILKTSPKQYLISYRIEKACHRLKNTNQSISEIAESVGYANQFYFAKEFKRNLGMTPSEYRRTPDVSPDLAELFNYRMHVPTLKAEFENYALGTPSSLAMEETVFTITAPTKPKT